jgi:hypothetical protein
MQNTYTFAELKEQTGLREEELAVHLFPLMNPKLGKLLVKENMKTPKCTPDEKISVNLAFAATNLKLVFIPATHQARFARFFGYRTMHNFLIPPIEISGRA